MCSVTVQLDVPGHGHTKFERLSQGTCFVDARRPRLMPGHRSPLPQRSHSCLPSHSSRRSCCWLWDIRDDSLSCCCLRFVFGNKQSYSEFCFMQKVVLDFTRRERTFSLILLIHVLTILFNYTKRKYYNGHNSTEDGSRAIFRNVVYSKCTWNNVQCPT
jgi:hypothetical protein